MSVNSQQSIFYYLARYTLAGLSAALFVANVLQSFLDARAGISEKLASLVLPLVSLRLLSSNSPVSALGLSLFAGLLKLPVVAAGFVVNELERGVAVLVHCSDGWDRTAQLTALAQVLL